jgi:hypothetical protein
LTLSDEKIFDVNTAIEIQFGIADALYNSNHAYELAEQIKILERNIKVKQSRDLFSVLDDKINELTTYCKKYRRNHELVIKQYESNKEFVCAI